MRNGIRKGPGSWFFVSFPDLLYRIHDKIVGSPNSSCGGELGSEHIDCLGLIPAQTKSSLQASYVGKNSGKSEFREPVRVLMLSLQQATLSYCIELLALQGILKAISHSW